MAEQRQTVTLAPGESREVVFSITPQQAGHYSVKVNGLSGGFDVLPHEYKYSLTTEWDAEMPFVPNSSHSWTTRITNLGVQPFTYTMEVSWVWGPSGGGSGYLTAGSTSSLGTSENMPAEAGVYQLTGKLWIDDVYIDEFVLSKVEVGIVTKATLEGEIHLQGRPEPPDDSWITDLTVTFFEDDVVVRTEEDVITDDMGRFAISNVTPGVYNICVKSPRALSNLVAAVSMVAGVTTPVDFGELREGDADNDDAVLAGDYSLLHAAFGSVPGDPNWDDRCDFNRNGAVDAGDYSLLHANFGQVGDCYIG